MSNLTQICGCHGNKEHNMTRTKFSGNRGTLIKSLLQSIGRTEKEKVYNIYLWVFE